MRSRVIFSLVLCSAAAGATAAEKGQFGLQLKTSSPFAWSGARPVRNDLGVSFQLLPRFALRPHLGLGLSGSSPKLVALDVGATSVWSFRPGKAWSPYLGAGLTYSYADPPRTNLLTDAQGRYILGTPTMPAPPMGRNFVTFSTMAGLEYRINRRFSLFGEIGTAATPGTRYGWNGRDWEKRALFDARKPFRSGIGLTVNFK